MALSETTTAGPLPSEGEWYCPICHDYVPPEQVSYTERHTHCDGRVWWLAEGSLIAHTIALQAEVAMLKPDAKLGAAVRNLPLRASLKHATLLVRGTNDGVTGGGTYLADGWLVKFGPSERARKATGDTPDAALRAAGLMGAGGEVTT